jgi:hypothetical protein
MPARAGWGQRLAKWWEGEYIPGPQGESFWMMGYTQYPGPRRALDWLVAHWAKTWQFWIGLAATVALGIAAIIYK